MAMINAAGLKMEFGQSPVFDNVSFDIYENDKVGLIGVNGAGKTTLFKVLTKEYEAAEGSLTTGKNTVIGYMEQHACHNSNRTVFDEILTVFSSLIDLEIEIHKVNLAIERGSDRNDIDRLIEKQQKINEEFQNSGGLTYVSRASATLIGLGFSREDFEKPVSVLSGGQKSKLSLGKLLLSGANVLLLDEPTNHLDIKSVEWLENWLMDFSGSFIVISHDRYFLDKVTNKTMELQRGKLTVAKGNYTRFIELKREREETKRRHYEQTMREVERIQGIIEQQKRFNQERNYITVAHKQKSIDRLLEGLEEPEKELKSLEFSFKTNRTSGNDVLRACNLSKSFNGKRLFENVDFLIKRNERVFLLGDNGCGKTTLLKILLGQYKSDTGECDFGTNVDIGYFDQTLAELDEGKTVLDEVWDAYRQMTESRVRTALGSFLFSGDDVFKNVSQLSGGEKARVALLKLMLKGANFLLLDEPTNHLDIKSREALENALLGYNGTMLIVSHDRYLINKLATRIFRISGNGIQTFSGNYDYYLKHFKEPEEPDAVKEKKQINDYKLKKQRQSELRRKKGEIERCEKKIEEIEKAINEAQEKLGDDEISSSYIRVSEITAEIDALRTEQDELMERWERLQEELEEME